MSIKTLIIEDEEKSVYILQELITQLAPDFKLCGSASHINNAVRLIESCDPDLVFLDIRIADGTGFDVLRQVSSHNFAPVFITAYDSYALEAFRFAAIDYLLKPVGTQELEATIERARKRLADKNWHDTVDALLWKLSPRNMQYRKLSIPTLHGYELVDIKDIIWCRSDGSYTTFHLSNHSKVISSHRMGLYEEQLAACNFFRIHHSIIINMQLIKSYVKGKGGYVVMTDGTELEVSQRRRAEFLERLVM